MKNVLEIKFKNQSQFFELLEDKIIVDLNTTKHNLKYNIPLEDIQTNVFIQKSKENEFTLIAYLSILLNIYFIIYMLSNYFEVSVVLKQSILISSLFPLLLCFKNYNEGFDEKHIESTKILYFIYTKNNKTEIDNFIKLIFKMQIDFFRKKYLIIDPILPYNIQLDRYLWLYSNKYINQDEFEIIKEELDKYFNFDIKL
jgi:hypothetical protein